MCARVCTLEMEKSILVSSPLSTVVGSQYGSLPVLFHKRRWDETGRLTQAWHRSPSWYTHMQCIVAPVNCRVVSAH